MRRRRDTFSVPARKARGAAHMTFQPGVTAARRSQAGASRSRRAFGTTHLRAR